MPGMKDDFSDIRFSDYKRTLPYWIESYTSRTSATVWVKLTETDTAAKEFFLYYGNGAAVSESSGTSVFPFFDDFPGSSVNTALWEYEYGSGATVSGGILTLENIKASIRPKTAYGTGYALRCYIRTAHFGEAGVAVVRREHVGFGLAETYPYTYQAARFYGETGYGGVYNNYNGSHVYDAIEGWTANTWGVFEVRRLASSALYLVNDANLNTISTQYNTGSLKAFLYTNNQGGTVKLEADWVLIRSTAATEPTCTISGSGINPAYPILIRYQLLLSAPTLTATQVDDTIQLEWVC